MAQKIKVVSIKQNKHTRNSVYAVHVMMTQRRNFLLLYLLKWSIVVVLVAKNV